MNTFRDKLKEIRSEEEQRVRDRVPLTDAELGLNDGTELCLEVRSGVVGVIESLMAEFIAEAPAFRLHRGFFEGKYSIELAADELYVDDVGEPGKFFSRITYLLDACTAKNHRLGTICKMTVWNQDLPKASHSARVAVSEDVDDLREFAESEMLRFAQEYFKHRRGEPANSSSVVSRPASE